MTTVIGVELIVRVYEGRSLKNLRSGSGDGTGEETGERINGAAIVERKVRRGEIKKLSDFSRFVCRRRRRMRR